MAECHEIGDRYADNMDALDEVHALAGYICKCQSPLVGHGHGSQGCYREKPVNECESLRNPCGRNSICTDMKDGYKCTCEDGYKSPTRDGKNCIMPVEVVDPTDTERCHGFCPYTRDTKGECHLRDITSL